MKDTAVSNHIIKVVILFLIMLHICFIFSETGETREDKQTDKRINKTTSCCIISLPVWQNNNNSFDKMFTIVKTKVVISFCYAVGRALTFPLKLSICSQYDGSRVHLLAEWLSRNLLSQPHLPSLPWPQYSKTFLIMRLIEHCHSSILVKLPNPFDVSFVTFALNRVIAKLLANL